MNLKVFVGLTFESVMKFVLPVVTTVSNFGPVRDLVRLYTEIMTMKFAKQGA
jgi:hypothetical protein